MKNMKIGLKLALGYAVILVLLVAVGVVGLFEVKAVNNELQLIVEEENRAVQEINDLAVNAGDLGRLIRSYVIYSDQAAKARAKRDITTEIERVKSHLDELETLLGTLDHREIMEGLRPAANAYVREIMETLSHSESGWAQERLESDIENEVTPLGSALRDRLDKSRGQVEALIIQASDRAKAQYDIAFALIVSLIVIAVILGIVIALVIGRSIVVPINEAVEAARAVARGELDSDLRSDRKDETGLLINALAEMRDNLRDIVTNIREGVDMINTASGEVAVGNTDLSQRTEEQASSLEETAASMEELTTTVKQNADNSKQANSLAKAASENADKGGDVVDSVVARMAEIRKGSTKMSEIISVIDGIAFQTNILALNAAVEAARAGEQGRGFAVVATEVRSLAQRSASAAKDIKSLIESSIESITTGSELADRAGTSMDEIVVSIKKVTDIIGEISAASDEQSAGIEQINQAVSEMDQVTQQNAALVEESAAAAESLQSQAEDLESSVSQFRLSTSDNAGAKAPKKQAPRKSRPIEASRSGGKSTGNEKPSKTSKPASGEKDDDWEEF